MQDIQLTGDAIQQLQTLPSNHVDSIVTSPPYYGKRDYGQSDQIGLEPTLFEYVENLASVFREAKRVLKPEGTFWLNLGDSYFAKRSNNGASHSDGIKSKSYQLRAGDQSGIYKPKDLMLVPFHVAMALQADGWYLRQVNIWHKTNPMPESVKDRTTTAHEYVFQFPKSERYFYNQEAIREPAQDWGSRGRSNGKYVSDGEPSLLGGKHSGLKNGNFSESGRNARTIWEISTANYAEAHFATMPIELATKCIKAGCPKGGIVLDPFGGAGTTAVAALQYLSHYILIELNPEYVELAQQRIDAIKSAGVQLDLFE